MKIRAAVFREHTPSIEELELTGPGPGEVLVRIVATGVCHTDLKTAAPGGWSPRPVVLGHEGSGVVEEVGAGVTRLAPGDHVVMSIGSCGRCPACLDAEPAYCHDHNHFACTRPDGEHCLSAGGQPVHGDFFNQSSFATHAIGKERGVVKVRKDAPLELLGPLGCGDPVAPRIKKLLPDGVDFALDTTAVKPVMEQAIEVLAPRGTCGFVAPPEDGSEISVSVRHLMKGRKVRGIMEGNTNPDAFIPRLIDFHMQGRFPFDRLVRFYPFDEIDQAFHDSETGATIKPILRMG